MSEGPVVKKKIIVKKKVDSVTTVADSVPADSVTATAESDTNRKAEEEAREAEEAVKKAALEEEKKTVLEAEAAKKITLEEAAKKAALEEAMKKASLEEAAKEAAKKVALEESAKKAALEEAAKKAVLEEEKKALEEEKKAALEEEKKAALEEATKKAALEEAAKKALEEEKKAALEEAAKKALEEEKKAALEAEAEKKAALEAEKIRKDEEAKKAALEAEKIRKDEEAAKKAVETQEKNIEAPKEVSNGITDRYNFKDGHWEDKGTYYLNNYDQGTDGWKNARFRRLTASNFGYASGFGTFENSAPLDIALDITRIKTKVFSEESIGYMAHGTKTEPKVREWYSKLIGKPITEVGLAVPKWEIRIGGSLDGDIENTDECIEIKCPKAMYGPLVKHIERTKEGWKPPRFYHDHIWKSHYAQMQGCMKITNKKWCHYIVFDATNEKVFFEKIEFNESYWENELYPKIKNFLDNMLEPLLRDGVHSPLIAHLNLGDR